MLVRSAVVPEWTVTGLLVRITRSLNTWDANVALPLESMPTYPPFSTMPVTTAPLPTPRVPPLFTTVEPPPEAL